MRKYLSHPVDMTPTDWAVDAIVAAGAFGFACLQLTFANALLVPDELLRRLFGLMGPISPAMALGAVALTTLPLVLRRRFPWPVLGLTLMAWALFQPSVGAAALSLAGPLAALFTLACERPRGETLAAAGCVLAVLLLPQALGALAPTRPGPGAPVKPQDVSALMLVQNVALTLVASFAGYALHVRQDYLRAAEERAEEAERTREATARRRVEEERLRIAREVHDITAHSLSAVSIQAAAAERLVEADPPAAKEAIGQVRAIAKDALDEMRAIVGVLRSGGDRMPTQGTDRLGDLAVYLADAGVEAVVDASAYQRAVVPAYIDVALFSMAREAVTNVVRHAGASRSWVRLATAEAPGGGLEARLSVEDDGCGIAPAAMSAGHGLEGLAERAALLGGTLAVGPRAAAAEGAQGRGGEGGAVAGVGGRGVGTGPAALAGSAGGAGGAGSVGGAAGGASNAAGADADVGGTCVRVAIPLAPPPGRAGEGRR